LKEKGRRGEIKKFFSSFFFNPSYYKVITFVLEQLILIVHV
jgi:hypothetical protein